MGPQGAPGAPGPVGPMGPPGESCDCEASAAAAEANRQMVEDHSHDDSSDEDNEEGTCVKRYNNSKVRTGITTFINRFTYTYEYVVGTSRTSVAMVRT